MAETLPKKANGYYVVGKCQCGELLTVQLGASIDDVSEGSPTLRHVSNYRRECGQPLAKIVERQTRK